MTRELKDSFRELRNAWFLSKLKSYCHERNHESDRSRELREEGNRLLKEVFDSDTELIIKGHNRCIAPKCNNDLQKKESVK